MQPSIVIRNLFASPRMRLLLAHLQFRFQQIRNSASNRKFRREHPGLSIPSDRDLFETFQVNYEKYFSDGALAATEIMEWYAPYRNAGKPIILDWGCGTGRVIRHIPQIVPEAVCHGCDSNKSRINWARQQINQVQFSTTEGWPLPYNNNQFNLIFGISVLTHTAAAEQMEYIRELHRILQPGGILILSTHGSNYTSRLSGRELETYLRGAYTRSYHEKGHRLICTYNHAAHFRQALATYFMIQEFYDGKSHPNKLGGQDLWIVQKAIADY
ncbi:MAG: class I SAM-dependent methyltransferase [Sediminibacterium sp.]|nr:class I SAM-dependent methyltransferase [Sediminibacterium sp.]